MSANDNNDNGGGGDDDDDDGETTKVVESTTVNRILDAPATTTNADAEELNNAGVIISSTSIQLSSSLTTNKTASGGSGSGAGPSRSEKRGQHSKSSGSRKQTSSSSNQHASSADADHTNAGDGCIDLDVKKMKKESKSSPPIDSSLRQPYQTFPASSYLQGLTALAHPYAGLFSADPNSVASGAAAFLTEPHFASYQTASADLQRSLAESSGKNKESLLGALNQVDASALRHLVIGYREAAALLNRTADELENFLCTRK